MDEEKAINELRIQLVQLASPIKQLASNAQLLSGQGLSLSPVIEVESVIDTVRKVSERFQEEPKSSTLRQGSRWSALKNKLEVLATKTTEVQVSDWKTFFSSNFFGGLPPVQRGAQLAPTPENKKALELYKKSVPKFH